MNIIGGQGLNYGIYKSICEKHKAEYSENQALSQYTSFKIGGSCPLLIKPNSVECLCELMSSFSENQSSYKIMGKGSNLLISGKGIDCPVIVISSALGEMRFDSDTVICQSGLPLITLCNEAANRELSGLEFAYGIPGSVGGAVYMNAGAYGGEMRDIIVSCTYADEKGRLHQIQKEDMELSYRHSFFSGKPYIITDVTLKLQKGDKKSITEKMQELMNKRREKQPLEYASAGSTFKRPEGDFAGRLIEAAGMKGFAVGAAQVSEKHCGFVINKGNAAFDDVVSVINAVKEKVKETSGRDLECEVIIWE
ncbi:MAG: UDP-N-acetylmuramate dehydrogenase [Ruminiclostridium sp.]|nr:UDP-N-acetylmuramate dehydrogenase [Ruminiclostridium sp.]